MGRLIDSCPSSFCAPILGACIDSICFFGLQRVTRSSGWSHVLCCSVSPSCCSLALVVSIVVYMLFVAAIAAGCCIICTCMHVLLYKLAAATALEMTRRMSRSCSDITAPQESLVHLTGQTWQSLSSPGVDRCVCHFTCMIAGFHTVTISALVAGPPYDTVMFIPLHDRHTFLVSSSSS